MWRKEIHQIFVLTVRSHYMQIQNTSENGISHLQDCHHGILKEETIKVLSEDASKTEKSWILDWHKQKVS